ncbi:MAG: cobalamin B12-binding domain-containing protein [Candidatus Firestonebacteria bacterium]|nr:cobalamin B12-binding domain-containing protein [Candidatus Firestonebacteria bacterium]
MKIFLIQPSGLAKFNVPPLGLRLLATVLKKNNYDNIYDIDSNKGDDPYKINYCGDKILVGLSVTFMTIKEANKLAEHIKKINNKAIVVFGGPHATLVPEESINNSYVDMVVLGEGEYTFLEIANAIIKGNNFRNIEGLWYKINGEIIRNEKRAFLEDLNILPIPDRIFFNDKLYHQSLNRKKITWHLISSQSCPFNCKMCQPALRNIAGPYRQRSVDNVIKEIQYLKDKFNTYRINFCDNDMGVNKNWLLNLCEITKKITDLEMSCCGRANLLDYDMLKNMKEGNFHYISYGAESGNDRVLKEIMNKKTTVQQVIDFANNCFKLDIVCNAFWMLANPGETIQEMKDTIHLASELPTFYCHFHIATPNPGTQYYLDAKSEGYLNMKTWNDVDNRETPTIIKQNVTIDDIIAMDEYLINTMIKKGWRYWYNGHTLSFINTRLFSKKMPVTVFGNEVKGFLSDFKSYHLNNIYLGLKNILGYDKIGYRKK